MSEAALARSETREMERYYERMDSLPPARIYKYKFNPPPGRTEAEIEDDTDYAAISDALLQHAEILRQLMESEEKREIVSQVPNDNLPRAGAYPVWLKILSVITIVVLVGGFVGGTIWHGSLLIIGVPLGFTLWWIVAKAADAKHASA